MAGTGPGASTKQHYANSAADTMASPAPGYPRQDRGEQQRHHQQQEADDTSTHVSLAAMSTDDVSSMGETLNTAGSRRKRKDDCSESRCTATSEDDSRSHRRRRCRSLIPDQRRWLDRIDRKAATSNAPIRPRRSDDDSLAGQTDAATAPGLAIPPISSSNSKTHHTLPRIEPSHSSCAHHPDASSAEEAANNAREVARCQSMSLPPVRPTRTRDDSKTDLMNDDDDDEDNDSNNIDTEKNEIDPDMFVRLLSGEQVVMDGQNYRSKPSMTPMGSHPPITTSSNNHNDPPKKPRRRSDADAYEPSQYHPNFQSLRRANTLIPKSSTTTDHAVANSCPHKSCLGVRDTYCSHAISPKPPAKPHRTLDDSNHEAEGVTAFPNLPHIPSPPLKPLVRDNCDEQVPTFGYKTSSQVHAFQQGHHTISCSSHMDLERSSEPPSNASQEKQPQLQQVVADEDETEVSLPTSVKEYDADLFARLLYGDPTPDVAVANLQEVSKEQDPPPPLLARVSTSSTMPATPSQLGYNRFDNSAPCAMPEHIKGAVKSSHPPMQPRRSFDEGMYIAVSLANAAAAACMAGASSSSMMITESLKPRLCIAGTKRRYCRRLSRRSTLALTSDLEPSQKTDKTSSGESSHLNDPTHEVNLTPLDESFPEEYVQERISSSCSSTLHHGYQPILPARRQRRVVRRFTMPPKGATPLSPTTKKRRLVGRSLSCRSSDSGATPLSPTTKKRRLVGRSLSCRSSDSGATPAA